MLEDGFFNPLKAWQVRQGDLPHWRQDGGLYFVTLRLSDSLPQGVLDEWKREQDAWRIENAGARPETITKRLRDRQKRMERWLHRGYGSCILANPEAKRIVAGALRFFDGVRYELGDFAVAANHAHALLRTALDVDLSEVLYSWKRFTATRLMRAPAVRTAFEGYRHLWQTESFDHIVRNGKSLEKIRKYIRSHDR